MPNMFGGDQLDPDYDPTSVSRRITRSTKTRRGVLKKKTTGNKTLRGYSTKYALTKGIEQVVVKEDSSGYLYGQEAYLPAQYFINKDFFLTIEEAEKDMLKQINRKLLRLTKQVQKLRASRDKLIDAGVKET